MLQSLLLKKDSIVKYLKSLSKISDSAVISTKDDRLISLLSNADSTLYVVASYYQDGLEEFKLNCPSLKKLTDLISMTNGKEVELKIEDNKISYKSDGVKFKYHLLEDGLITTPKLTLEKLENFEYDVEFDVTSEFMSSLMKFSSNIDTNRLYFKTVDGKVICDLTDETVANSDSLSLPVKESVDFDLKFVFRLDNLRLLTFSNISRFKFNTKLGISCIESEFEGHKFLYVSPSLTK